MVQQVTSNGTNIEAVTNELRSLVHNFGIKNPYPEQTQELMEFKKNAVLKLDELDKRIEVDAPCAAAHVTNGIYPDEWRRLGCGPYPRDTS